MRYCCGQARALSVSFQDNQGNEILRFERPLRCLGCCSDCCYPSLTQVMPSLDEMLYFFESVFGEISLPIGVICII